jgi:hypothetical protein
MRESLVSKRRLLGLALAAPLVVAACGGSASQSRAPAQPSQAPTAQSSAQGMPVPSWARSWKVNILSPKNGTKVTANQLTLDTTFSGFKPSCAAGMPTPVRGVGHYHVMLDGSLVDMYCTPKVNVSMEDVKPGQHTLSVVPALSDHMDLTGNEQSVKIDYEPSNPQSQVTPATFPAPPSIKVLGPAPGTTVSGNFTVQVQVSNFNVSCALEGKPDVAGYGHWHVNLDTTNSAMGGMATMARMSCTDTMQLTTQGFTPGKHTLIAYLADNQHAPINPMVASQLDVNFG